MKRIFTAIVLLLTTTIAFAQNPAPCSDLFFSEYIEGTNNNKVLEIFNPTSGIIDLSDYKVWISYNGGSTLQSVYLQGTLSPDSVYVLANSSAFPAVLALADQVSGALDFNGDDAVALIDTATNDTIDIIGEIGIDPGAFWVVGTGSTQLHTLTRMANVNNGQLDWVIGATEWNVFASNDFTQLGVHTMTPCAAAPPEVFLISTAQSVIESGISVSIQVGINNPNASATTVTLTASDISASTGSDYNLTGNPVTVTFPANSSANETVTINIIDDLTVEPTETFSVDLSNPTNGATLGATLETITITDDDSPPQVYFVSATQSISEGAGSVSLQIGINNPNANATAVTLTLNDQSATSLQDYMLSGNPVTVTFPGGSSANQTVVVSILEDIQVEINETFSADLSNPTNGATIGTTQEIVTITDNDAAINSFISFWLADDTIDENAGTFSAQMEIFSGTPTTSPTTIDVSLVTASSTATDGTDFTFNDTTITWPAADVTSKYAVFHITDDVLIESMEHFVFTLSNPTNNSAVGNTGSTTIYITDNDPNSIKNILGDKNSLLIPNPANDKVILITNGQFDYYEIRDAAGRIIAATNIHAQTASTILLNNYTAGIYFVYLHNAEGAEVMKLMKQ